MNPKPLDHFFSEIPYNLFDFAQTVMEDAKRLKVEVKAYKYGDLSSEGSLVNGYFDDEERVLAFSVKEDNDDWLHTFVHEYGHMLQWANRRKFWDKVLKHHPDLWRWVGGKPLSNKKLDRALRSNITIEWDNEKQTVGLINKFVLPIDVELYTQKAIAYVLFYHVVRKNRKFYTAGREPYNLPEVYSHMPKTFDIDPYNPPKELMDILFLAY